MQSLSLERNYGKNTEKIAQKYEIAHDKFCDSAAARWNFFRSMYIVLYMYSFWELGSFWMQAISIQPIDSMYIHTYTCISCV